MKERIGVMSKSEREFRVREIRILALAALNGEIDWFEPWHYYGELKYLRSKPFHANYLEAVIATCAVGRIRYGRVLRLLRLLRAIRKESGEIELFTEFEDRLSDEFGPSSLTSHGYDSKTFADMKHDELWDKVNQHLSVLKDKGYQVFLNSGTLLGVTRDKRLIDHDDDVDLAIILKATNSQDAAREWLELKDMLIEQKIFDKKHFKNPAIYKLLPFDDCLIDLFPVWFEDGKAYVYPHTYADLDKDDVLPLKPCEVSGNPVPANPEKMLLVNYGETWREPDPYFKFSWKASRVRFEGFLGALQ